MTDDWAEQFKPLPPKLPRGWGWYFAAKATQAVVDFEFKIRDALDPPEPLYVPEDSDAVWALAEETLRNKPLPTAEQAGQLWGRIAYQRFAYAAYPSVLIRLLDLAEDLYIYAHPYMTAPIPIKTGIEAARWRDTVKAEILYCHAFNVRDCITAVYDVTAQFMAHLPPIAQVPWERFEELIENDEQPAGLQIDLRSMLALPEVIERLMIAIYNRKQFFFRIVDTFDANMRQISRTMDANKFIWPTAYKGDPLDYVQGTPLQEFFA